LPEPSRYAKAATERAIDLLQQCGPVRIEHHTVVARPDGTPGATLRSAGVLDYRLRKSALDYGHYAVARIGETEWEGPAGALLSVAHQRAPLPFDPIGLLDLARAARPVAPESDAGGGVHLGALDFERLPNASMYPPGWHQVFFGEDPDILVELHVDEHGMPTRVSLPRARAEPVLIIGEPVRSDNLVWDRLPSARTTRL
jgi:hypothetical protein